MSTQHDTAHLFSYPRDSTDLNPTSLWLHSREAAKFPEMDMGDEALDENDVDGTTGEMTE